MAEIEKAVALKYPEDADAPFITAKAKGEAAKKLVQIAQKNNIPVVEDDVLVNVLSIQKEGELIPEQTFEVIAKIFAFIAKLENKNAGKNVPESGHFRH